MQVIQVDEYIASGVPSPSLHTHSLFRHVDYICKCSLLSPSAMYIKQHDHRELSPIQPPSVLVYATFYRDS